jgi:hypothetical protein
MILFKIFTVGNSNKKNYVIEVGFNHVDIYTKALNASLVYFIAGLQIDIT